MKDTRGGNISHQIFTISENTEADATKNKEPEQAKKPQSITDLEDTRKALKLKRYFRELIQIKKQASSIG